MGGTNGSGPGIRRLTNWISSFCEYTENLYAPKIYRKWSAISILAGALERKAWVHTRGNDLYPNLYVLLIGPPAAGKSTCLKEVQRLWKTLSEHRTSSASLTSASLADEMAAAVRKIVRPMDTPPYIEFNSLLAAVTEFSEFAPMYDPMFMSRLQVLYDCEELSERRRGKPEGLKIPNPQLNMISGTTPSYLADFMPDGAWTQGFISRTIMVFAEQEATVDLFSLPQVKDHLFQELKYDLNVVGKVFGKFGWEAEAASAVQTWVSTGLGPLPEHNRLTTYNSRRTAHMLKLCMIMSISRSNDLVINLSDFEAAMEVLIEAEFYMPKIFELMAATSADGQVMEDTYHHFLTMYAKNSIPIPEWKLTEFVRQRVPSYAVVKIIDIMMKSRMIELTEVRPGGLSSYRPIARN